MEQEAIARVDKFLVAHEGLKAIRFESSTHTAEMAAETLGVTAAQIAKTLCFSVDGSPILVVTCDDKKVDARRLARAAGGKKARFADAETVARVTGFPPGGVSPVGVLTPVPVLLDESLYRFDVVYAAAGSASSALPIAPQRLVEITQGTLVDICL